MDKRLLLSRAQAFLSSPWRILEGLDPQALLQKLMGEGERIEKGLGSKISARNDLEAIQAWLSEYAHKDTTFRSYKKEAERFLIWILVHRNACLQTCGREDIDAYISFLQNPQPRHLWCGPKGGRAKHAEKGHWYPFSGPLSHGAIRTSLTILNSLMGYLTDARYVEFNPFTLIRRKGRFQQKLSEQSLRVVERILDEEEWQALLNTLKNWPENTPQDKKEKARLTFLVAILFLLGLRIEELASHSWNAFRKLNTRWWFFVHGKGGRLGKIPVNNELVDQIIRYRTFLGLSPLPNEEDFGPIMASHLTGKALSTRQLSNIIKELGLKTAQFFADQPERQKKLKKFSPHWLRHLSASRQDSAGVPFRHIQANHRHQNEQTTRQYIHALDSERHEEMEKLHFGG